MAHMIKNSPNCGYGTEYNSYRDSGSDDEYQSCRGSESSIEHGDRESFAHHLHGTLFDRIAQVVGRYLNLPYQTLSSYFRLTVDKKDGSDRDSWTRPESILDEENFTSMRSGLRVDVNRWLCEFSRGSLMLEEEENCIWTKSGVEVIPDANAWGRKLDSERASATPSQIPNTTSFFSRVSIIIADLRIHLSSVFNRFVIFSRSP